ncbi:MAG: hypothetical protein ACJZ9F_03020 [Rhodospirillaceae bacterium]
MNYWRRYRLHFLACFLVLITAAVWIFMDRWTPDEVTNAQHFRKAMLEVRGAIAYANGQGGIIDPAATEILISRYTAAAEHAGKVTNSVIAKLHPKLKKIWLEAFVPSTNLYLRALQDQDRDLARYAGQLQDDWIRWLQLNGQDLDIPEPLEKVAP